MSALADSTGPADRGQKLALTVGFLALAIAVVAAYASPADGYEVSIYAATPLAFWVGIGVAVLVAVPITIYSSRGYVNLAGALLGGGAVVAVAALPLLRTYYYYGRNDSLTHLGWARDIADGTASAFGVFYPGIHTYGVFTSETIGFGIPRAMMLVVLLMLVAFIVFTALCVRSMTTHRGAVVLGALVGLLVMPINHIGTHYMSAHPITDAVLLTPIVLYLLINYLTASTDGFESRYPVSSVGVLLAISLGGIVLYHPQQAANLIILFITFSAIQFLYRSARPANRIAEHTTLYGQTLFLIGSFMLWSIGRGRYERSVGIVIEQLFSFLRGGGELGATVQSGGSSLTAVGSGLPELFLKLFSVSAVFVALTGLLMLTSLAGRLEDAPDTDALVKYFTVGLTFLVPYSLVFFIGQISRLFFRNFGLIMVFTTILGTIALYRYVTGLSSVFPTRVVRAGTTVAVVIMLALSLVVVFPSPYVFLPNGHVTQGEMVNYRIAFDHQADEDPIPIYGLRGGPWRLKQGIYGVEGVPVSQFNRTISDENLTDRFAGDRYFAISEAARDREVVVYEQLQYSQSNITAFRNRPDVHRVQSGDGFDLYYIPGNETDAAAAGTGATGDATGGVSAGGNDTGSPANTTAANGATAPTDTAAATPESPSGDATGGGDSAAEADGNGTDGSDATTDGGLFG